jgi:hypothetical protein
MSTFATLLVVPSIFALVLGRSKRHSVSVHPDDSESPYYDPLEEAEPQLALAGSAHGDL